MKLSYATWVASIERHHRLIIAVSVLVCIVSAVSLTRLRLDIDVLGMLPQGRPAFDDFKSFVADFGELDELVMLIQGAPLEQLERFADELTSRLAPLDTVAAVHGRINMARIRDGILGRYLYNYLPEAEYAELRERLTAAGIERQVAIDRAILSAPFDLSSAGAVVQDPLGVRQLAGRAFAEAYGEVAPKLRGGYFTSADASALLILVRPKQSAFDIDFSERLMREVRQAEAETRRDFVAAQHAAPSTLHVAYTGSYVYALEDAATLSGDIRRYTTLALIGVLTIFYIGYRNLRILPFVTYPLVVTTLVTFALSLLLFDQLNAVSISFAAILYGLSIDSGIYFYTRLLQEGRQQDARAAVTATLAGLGRANLAASATTAVGFFVIGFSCISAVRQLGILTGVGMLLTTVQFFTLFPALGFFAAQPHGGGASRLETRRLGLWARWASRHAAPVGVVAAVVGVGLLVLASRVSLDVTLTHLQPRESEANRVQKDIEARFGQQIASGAVLVRRDEVESALQDSETVAGQLARYKSEGALQSLQSVQALLPSARTQEARLKLYNELPRAQAAETLRSALQLHGFAPQPFAEFLAEFERPRAEVVRIDNPALAPLAFLIDHHLRWRQGEYTVATYLTPAADVSLGSIADRLHQDLGDLRFRVAGRGLLEDALAVVLHRELLFFFAVGLIGNLVLLVFSFGSMRTAVAILAPVVLVVIAIFAAMTAAGIPLDPINLIVTPLIFGIGVDYGVYIVARARQQAGVPQAIHSFGRAVVVAALTTIAGFGFLGLSRFPPLRTMGLLAGAGLFLCLVLSIILLPALLTLTASPWKTTPEAAAAEG
jgi:predicted RND superfamily exporter protein